MSKVTIKARYNEEILRSLTVTNITSESSETSTKYVSERVSIVPETRPGFKFTGYTVNPSNLTNLEPGGNNFTFNMPNVNVIMSGKWEDLYSKYLDITSDGLVSGNALLAAEADDSVEMIIPKSVNGIKVRGIKNEGFMNSRKLNSVILPEGLTTIGDRAFSSAQLLNTIILPSTLQSIGNYAFKEAPIQSIDIPDSVTTMGTNIFEYCRWLRNLKWSKNYNNIPEKTFYNGGCPPSFSIPNNIIVINKSAFYGCAFTSLVFPGRLHIIDDSAFSRSNISCDLNIPSTVKTLGKSCFTDCVIGGDVNIAAGGVTTIPSNAFAGVRNLTITIPNTVTNIDASAFSMCSMATITINKPQNSIAGSPWGASGARVKWNG